MTKKVLLNAFWLALVLSPISAKAVDYEYCYPVNNEFCEYGEGGAKIRQRIEYLRGNSVMYNGKRVKPYGYSLN